MGPVGGPSTSGYPRVWGLPRAQVGTGATFACTPFLSRGWVNLTGRAALCDARPAGVVPSARRSALRDGAYRSGPAWRRVAPGFTTTVPSPSPSMSVDGAGGTSPERRLTYAEQPEEPALEEYWRRTIKLMDCVDGASLLVEEVLEAGVLRSHDELNVLKRFNTLAISGMNPATESLLSCCSRKYSCRLPALTLVLLWRQTLLERMGGLDRLEVSAYFERGSLKRSPDEQQRLKLTVSLLLDFCEQLQVYSGSLLALGEEVRKLFATAYPVAAMLNDQGALLPAGQQRPAGSVLATYPLREEELVIPRDDEVVRACAHLSSQEALKGTRAAWYLVSSPGMGKTHFLEDLSMVLGALRETRYAEAAARVNLKYWENIVSELEGTRLCFVSFNGVSLWSKVDEDFISDVAAHPNMIFLPVYLRVLWCLRCAERDWDWFAAQVLQLVTASPGLVDVIINEATRALGEQRTIVAIEELNKVTPFEVSPVETSPTELECGLASTDLTESPSSEPKRTVSLLSVYRHEVCTWTRFTNVTVLLTAPFPGLVLAEVRKLLSKEESAAFVIESENWLQAAGLNIQTRSLLLTSLSSRRAGSPYFLLPAAAIGFLDMDLIADIYFLPVFREAVVVRTSLPWKSSFRQPSKLSARAFARLSGGHPRSAALLLSKLQEVSASCSVWSSVVEPAGILLSQSLSLSALLSELLVVPAILLAALHNCTLDSEQPLVVGVNVPGLTFKVWDDVVSHNVLVGAVKTLDGTYVDPCMPPLFLVALVAKWKTVSNILADATASELLRLKGVFDALSKMLHAADEGGASSRVWEFVSLYADVALTRLRAAAPAWTTPSPGVSLPYDYRSVTLMQLYPGNKAVYSAGERPLLDNVLLNAVPDAVVVNEDEAANQVSAILERDAMELVSTVFKCKPEQAGFDSMKFLHRSGTANKVKKEHLMVICKSAKVTGNAGSYLVLNEDVRKSLELMEEAFGKSWEQWKGRVVLVVESNKKIAKVPLHRLTKKEGNMVIVVGVDDLKAVYGRTLGGLMGDGPSLYDAKVQTRR